jgi:hypothetical protein
MRRAYQFSSEVELVLVLQDCLNPTHNIFVLTWLDATLLSDVNSGHDHSGIIYKTHMGDCFLLLLFFTNEKVCFSLDFVFE